MRLIYQTFSKLLSRLLLRARSDTNKEIEILVLRHQLAVLQRRSPRRRMSWTERALIAALTRLLPASRRLCLFVAPATVLRWHRQLVTRRWTTSASPPGRASIPSGLRSLVVRLATVAGVPAVAASRVVAIVGEVIGDLSLERGLDKPLSLAT
jgi:hypothetical protein